MNTVQDIYSALQEKAPFETAEPWDNSGLLVGDKTCGVSTVYVSLDITAETVEQAIKAGAQLVVSHHPVIFDPLKTLLAAHPAYQLVRAGMAALCIHTNLDKAAGGVNDMLARQLGLADVMIAEDGMSRIGVLPQPLSAEDFAHQVNRALHTSVRMKAGTNRIRKVALCGGAGADLVIPLLSQTDAALTGEIKHHEWLNIDPAKTVIDAGHYPTENGVVSVLVAWLKEMFPSLTVVQGNQTTPYITVKD